MERGDAEEERGIANVLGRRRHELAAALFVPVAREKDLPAANPPAGLPLDAYLQRDFYIFVDLLRRFLETSDATFRDLLVGELARQLSPPAAVPDRELSEQRRRVLRAQREGVSQLLRAELDEAQRGRLEAVLAGVEAALTAPGGKTLRILMVGDCLLRDIVAFLIGPCLEDGVSLNIAFVGNKDPAGLRNELRAMRGRKFDLAFFSPFSYEFSPTYARLLDWRFAASGAARIEGLVEAAAESAFATAQLIGELFECTLFLHGSANVPRHDSRPHQLLRNALTLRARARGRRSIDRKVAAFLAARRAAGEERLFLLDELELVRKYGERSLGRVLHGSGVQRPAVLGKRLAAEYREAIAVHAHLLGRKLVICDLDQTLWKGLIGEGPVEHWPERQQTLRRLKEKGVVLAVSSKNDPAKVRWDGCALGPEDFVSRQIGWDPKPLQVKRILEGLNLQAKDCVFIDDRPDERELVRAAEPALQVLDADDARSWSLLSRWADLLPVQAEGDRTLLYQQRAARQGFLESTGGAVEEPGELFRKLEIRVRLREAARADARRAAELVNRTNQFNTCGTRTTAREMAAWIDDPGHRVLVIDSADKFGPVGTVAVLVARDAGEEIEIPAFVLSCRVFGYGIETVALNAVKKLARAGGPRRPVIGQARQTAHNDASRDVYARNGFERRGDVWRFDRDDDVAHPPWLAVDEHWRPFHSGEPRGRIAQGR